MYKIRHLNFALCIICLLVTSPIFGQKSITKQANSYFKAEKFEEALELYNQLENIEENEILLFRRGMSNYQTRNTDAAIKDFSNAKLQGYDETNIYLYTGLALQAQGSYRDAAQFYKNYLRFIDDKSEKNHVVERIKKCNFAYNNQYNDQLAFVENLGKSVNSQYDEINPQQSPTNPNKYYFSSNRAGASGGLRDAEGYKDEIYGSYSTDMYAAELSNGNWTAAGAFNPILNGPKNDIIQGLNPNGSVLYFIQSRNRVSGEMYADTFSINRDPADFPSRFQSPVISKLGDKDMQVFNDNTLIFASKRAGGFGGYDLYAAVFENGQWSPAQNLGPNINSAFDEVSPFLCKSGKKLYLSSDRLSGYGGFDIFESTYAQDIAQWEIPSNLGLPINSPLNELNFSLSFDGMTAILSSDRAGTIGGYDLYLAYYKDQVTDQLMYTEELAFLIYTNAAVDSLQLSSDSTTEESNVVPMKTSKPADIVKKEFLNAPLYYGSDEMIVTPSNRSKLDKIKNLMIVYPDVSIVLSGHSTAEGMREFDLYFSIKRAEKAAQYLVDLGIAPSRIKVRGLGANFPHTNPSVRRLADKNNRRIDVSFVKVPANRLTIISEGPVASEGMIDGSSDLYYELLQGLSYKIEVARTKQMYKGDAVRQFESGVVEKEFSAQDYIYTIGIYNEYKEAKQMKGMLIRSGNIDAKVIPYMNDQRLNTDQITVLKDIYPDLVEFMKFEK